MSTFKMLADLRTVTEQQRLADHQEKKAMLLVQFQQTKQSGHQLTMGGKAGSYLFRDRQQTSKKLYMAHLNKVIRIDVANSRAHVEGMTTFFDLVQETLKHGLLPKVVPELRGITVGGAISGLAIESSSFQHGLFHEGVEEMEVLTGEGVIRTCRRDNDNSDLFYGMPNSYGTLGYVLSTTLELVRAALYVELSHTTFINAEDFFLAMQQQCMQKGAYDFIDGAIFAPNHMVMTVAKFVTQVPPFLSNYRQGGIYYQSMQNIKTDYLSTEDYIWRWDADSFWSTEDAGKPTILQHPIVRQLLGGVVLRTDRLRMLGKLKDEFNTHVVEPLRGSSANLMAMQKEVIIQDVGIPVRKCAEFVKWLEENIGIYPLFVCPAESKPGHKKFPLWELNAGALACDIGIFGTRATEYNPRDGFYNRKLERAVAAMGGKKSLYSQSYFTQQDFEEFYYGNGAYGKLKQEYDPQNNFPTLFEKCVRNR